MKRVILFTDTHYGIKNNSIIWFNSQKDFIEKQFIPYIRQAHPDEIIHLGDVFDIRSTVSVMIGEQVRDIFKEIASLTPRFVIIGGNHDFYSPTSDKYNSISMILRGIDNLHIFSSQTIIHDHFLYLPWYEWIKVLEGTYPGLSALEDGVRSGEITNVFTHSDIWREDIPIFHPINIFSGHIHTPQCDPTRHLYNLGSCYALTFADSNQERGFYDLTFDDAGLLVDLKFIANEHSIRFWRFYDDEIFDKFDSTNIKNFDYIELYISKKNLLKSEFSSRINDLSIHYKNSWCIPIIKDTDTISEAQDVKLSNFDMKSMIESYIPDELKAKFNRVVEIVGEVD